MKIFFVMFLISDNLKHNLSVTEEKISARWPWHLDPECGRAQIILHFILVLLTAWKGFSSSQK